MRQTGQALIYLLIFAFVAAAGVGVVYTYNTAITRAEKAEAKNATLTQKNGELDTENKDLRADNAKKDKLLAVRAAQRNANDETERRLNAKLDEIKNAIPAVRDWAAVPVPPVVLDGLRNEPGAPGSPGKPKAVPTGKPAGGSAGGRVAGLDYQLGAAGARAHLPPPAAGVPGR